MARSESAAPWDRARNASTITLWGDEPLPDHMRVEFDNGLRYRQINGTQIVGRCLLVSWPNNSYQPQKET